MATKLYSLLMEFLGMILANLLFKIPKGFHVFSGGFDL